MNYNLYIYGTKIYRKYNSLFRNLNWIITKTNPQNNRFDYLIEFDFIKIKKLLEKILPNLFKIKIKYFSQKSGKVAYLHLITTYKKIHEVLPKILAISEENKLVLYDAEINKTYYKEIDNERFVNLRIREKLLLSKIKKELAPIYKIRQLLKNHIFYREVGSEFVITIDEILNVSFEERILRLYNCLKNDLISNEELILDDKCLKLCCEDYFLRFCIEGYGIDSDKLGYINESKPCIVNLKRMGVEQGCKWLSKTKYTRLYNILRAMNYECLLLKYHNPSERFIEILKFSERLNKQPFDFGIGGLNHRNYEIVITLKDIDHSDCYYLEDSYSSSLYFGLISINLFKPIIEEYYPYFIERYYCFVNPIVFQAWSSIVNRVKEIKYLIENDMINSILREYANKIGYRSFYFKYSPKNETLEPIELIKKYKNEICELFSLFIEWSELQLDTLDKYSDSVFNIVGP